MTFDAQPRLHGELLTLRPATAADWDALYALGSDPDVWAQHPSHDRWQVEVFRRYFDDGLASGGALVAETLAGETAGWSRYSTAFADPGEVEIGWTFLGRGFWGGAFNAEMKRLMLQHAFKTFERVIFRIGENNLRSRRAAEKLGARLVEPTAAAIAAGGAQGNVFYALDRSAAG